MPPDCGFRIRALVMRRGFDLVGAAHPRQAFWMIPSDEQERSPFQCVAQMVMAMRSATLAKKWLSSLVLAPGEGIKAVITMVRVTPTAKSCLSELADVPRGFGRPKVALRSS